MALVSDIQLQSSAVKPPNLDTSQKFSAEGLTATTAFSVTDAGAGETVTPLGLMTAQSANDISAYFNTTNTDGDINLYLNNDANPYWNLKLSGTASDSFMITNACGGPAGGTAAEKTALSITPVGAVGIGKASASNALDISYQNSSSGGVVITEATNSIATKIISESSSGSIGTTTNSKFGFRTNSATVAAFDTSGNFGIGTDAPGAELDVRGAAIFNEAGRAVDFRIEGDTCANLFFVDGSADRIGIGTATPAVLLDIDNGGATSQLLMCVNGCICAAGYIGEKQGHTIEDSGTAETQRTGLNFVVTDVGCVVDDSSNDATVVCINGANTCVPFLMCDGSTSDPISLAGGSIGNQLSNDSNPTLGGLLCGGGNNICAVCCICITGCYFGNGSQLTGVSSVPSSFSGDCTIIGCSAGGNVAGGAEKVTLYGANAGYNATTPGNIVVIGESAGLCMTTASDVVLVGTGSGRCVLTCAGNVALGAWSLYNECAGTYNTVVGTCAGHTQKGGTDNVFVGSWSGKANVTGTGNVYIGACSGCGLTGSCCLVIGNGCCDLITGDFCCGSVSMSCVGIGTAVPGALLHLVRDNGSAAIRMERVDTSVASGNEIGGIVMTGGESSADVPVARIVTYADDTWSSTSSPTRIEFEVTPTGATADALAMTIDSTGYLGIGTVAPAQLLHIQGAASAPQILIEDTGNNTATLTLDGDRASENQESGKLVFGWNNNDIAKVTGLAGPDTTNKDDGQLSFQTAAPGGSMTEAMRIDESQNVGIGTDAPGNILSVEGSSTAAFNPDSTVGDFNIRNRATDTDQQFAGLSMVVGNGSGDGSARIDTIHNGTGTAADLAFSTSCSNASLYEHMRITESGNVGIGIATPTETLSLYTSNCTTCFTMISNGNADVPGIKFCSGASRNPIFSICGCWGEGTIFQDAHCGMAHAFQTCAVTRLFIDNAGNVGIGTSDPDAAAPTGSSSAKILKVDGGTGVDAAVQIVGHDSNHGMDLWTDVSTGDVYFDQRGNHNDYDFRFRTKTTGTPVDAMIISGEGNVGIGTTTPGQRLTVCNTTSADRALSVKTNQVNEYVADITQTTAGFGSGTGYPVLQLLTSNSGSGLTDFYYLNMHDSGSDKGWVRGDGTYGSATNSYGSTSDCRIKSNIVDATPKLDEVNQLRVVNFTKNDYPELKQIGLIAQEVQSVFPSMVDENLYHLIDNTGKPDESGTPSLNVKYSILVPILVKAIQELTARIEVLESA